MADISDRLYRRADGTVRVGERFEGRFPDDATHSAELPGVDDPRWRAGCPFFLDTQFIALSSHYPSGRLGVSIETRRSNPLLRHANHPGGEGCKAWMPVGEIRWSPIPRPERSRYVVLDERILGYLIPQTPDCVGILRVSAKENYCDPLQGTAPISPGRSTVRQATMKDFAEYRVMPPACFGTEGQACIDGVTDGVTAEIGVGVHFEVEMYFGGEWENIWSDDGAPTRFKSPQEALEGLRNHFDSIREAIELGDMSEGSEPDVGDFRIVRMQDGKAVCEFALEVDPERGVRIGQETAVRPPAAKGSSMSM